MLICFCLDTIQGSGWKWVIINFEVLICKKIHELNSTWAQQWTSKEVVYPTCNLFTLEYIFVAVYLFSCLPYESMCLSCEKSEACQVLLDISAPVIADPSETIKHMSLMFNKTDVNSQRLNLVFETCQRANYSTIGIDCSAYSTRKTLYYYMVYYPSQPIVFELEINTEKIGRPNGLAAVKIDMSSSTTQQMQRNVIKRPKSNSVSALKWLELTNTVLQGICTILLALTAALTCIRRWARDIFLLIEVVPSGYW